MRKTSGFLTVVFCFFQNLLLNADPNVLAQLQQLHRLLVRGGDSSAKAEGPPVHFDRKLLDFDYGDDEEEPQNPSPNVVSATNNAANDSVARWVCFRLYRSLFTVVTSCLQICFSL